MTAGLKLQEPRVFGTRTIVPVVSETSLCHGPCIVGSVRPVALLIEEDGKWGIALLEGDSLAELLERLLLPR
jgi:hypothetical protein